MILRFLGVFFFAATLLAQTTPTAAFEDRNESTLVTTLEKEPDPAKRLALLRRWTSAYPNSAFRQERFNETIKAYGALDNGKAMLETALQMSADDPYGLGNYWIALLTVSLQDTSPAALNQGRRAAETLLGNAPQSFAETKRAPAVSKADWDLERRREETLAHRALGWIALEQGQFGRAREEFLQVLKVDKDDAEVCYWLGTALLAGTDRESAQKGLYQVARALSIRGAGALLPEAVPRVRAYFDAAYRERNGNTAGQEALLREARSASANDRMND